MSTCEIALIHSKNRSDSLWSGSDRSAGVNISELQFKESNKSKAKRSHIMSSSLETRSLAEPSSFMGTRPTPSAGAKRRLSFNDSLSVHNIPHVDDLTTNQIISVWYSYDDIMRLKRSLQKSVKKLEQGKLKDSSKDCPLGLASMTQQGQIKYCQRRNVARGTVLRVQHAQRHGLAAPDVNAHANRLARIYAELSAMSQSDAAREGQRIEDEVLHLYTEVVVVSPPSDDDDASSTSTNSLTRLKLSIFGKSSSLRDVIGFSFFEKQPLARRNIAVCHAA
jgi:hypothetical protein